MAGGDFECPECGSSFSEGTPVCPGCGAEIDWDDEAVAQEEGVGEAERIAETGRSEAEDGVTARAEEGPEKVMSVRGVLFSTLTLAGLVATLLLLRWDTWVHGEAVESIGADQRALIYVTAVGTMAFSVLTIVDILRTSSIVGRARGGE